LRQPSLFSYHSGWGARCGKTRAAAGKSHSRILCRRRVDNSHDRPNPRTTSSRFTCPSSTAWKSQVICASSAIATRRRANPRRREEGRSVKRDSGPAPEDRRAAIPQAAIPVRKLQQRGLDQGETCVNARPGRFVREASMRKLTCQGLRSLADQSKYAETFRTGFQRRDWLNSIGERQDASKLGGEVVILMAGTQTPHRRVFR